MSTDWNSMNLRYYYDDFGLVLRYRMRRVKETTSVCPDSGPIAFSNHFDLKSSVTITSHP
jgi:hypothetical protein